MAHDGLKYPVPGSKVHGVSRPIEPFDDDNLEQAWLKITHEMAGEESERQQYFESSWTSLHDTSTTLPGLSIYGDDGIDEHQVVIEAFDVGVPYYFWLQHS